MPTFSISYTVNVELNDKQTVEAADKDAALTIVAPKFRVVEDATAVEEEDDYIDEELAEEEACRIVDLADPALRCAVVLTDFGDKKINVIKEVRHITGLGLAEAKDLVEATPAVVVEGVGEDLARKIWTTLEGTGASARIRLAAVPDRDPSRDARGRYTSCPPAWKV